MLTLSARLLVVEGVSRYVVRSSLVGSENEERRGRYKKQVQMFELPDGWMLNVYVELALGRELIEWG